MEAVFDRVKGVKDVISGYAGGHVLNPTYKQVKSGTTGHIEVVQVLFDPVQISYEELLRIFFYAHDPTSMDRQEDDFGSQYRSALFYHTEQQKELAEKIFEEIERSGNYSKPLVTQLLPISNFYVAEDYHQDYYEKNYERAMHKELISNRVENLSRLNSQKCEL